MSSDSASAYETHAEAFLAVRDHSSVGAATVAAWARSLAAGTEILELGCGGGIPVTRTLADAGHSLWAIDASPTLMAKFESRFPNVQIQCANALHCDYFNRRFGAVIAIGLVFLLDSQQQSALFHRIASALEPGGRFLFTAPIETGTWADATTGHECGSLGRDAYENILGAAGFRIIASYEDEGRNHYYEASKTQPPRHAAR